MFSPLSFMSIGGSSLKSSEKSDAIEDDEQGVQEELFLKRGRTSMFN